MDSKTQKTVINAEIVLASTFHDTDNRLEESIIKYGGVIKKTFQSSYIVVTPSTNQQVINTLNNLKFETSKGSKTIISAYKKALKQALTNNPKHIFYCDFDRILHWASTYPNEFKKITNSYFDHDFLLIGRTARAFKTHPETQAVTEGIANQLASKILGFKENRDIISACWRATSKLVEKLLESPAKNTYGFYCEWPIVTWRNSMNPIYIEVEGLEWETPNRYKEEIKEKGYERWLQEFQTPDEWKKRSKILGDSIESVSKYLRG